MKTKKFLFGILAIFFLLPALSPATPVRAATLTVSNTNDDLPSAGSLRYEIMNAHAGDTITFDASLAGKTIFLVSDLVINKNLTINGSGLNPHIRISGNTTTGIFDINKNVTVTLQGLNLVDGSDYTGGGISNAGTLTLKGVTLSRNHASYAGGGIYNSGTLTVKNTIFSGNTTFDSGGMGMGGFGGGIYNDRLGNLVVINGIFSTNSTGSIAGAGGAINGGTGLIKVTGSTFKGNSSNQGSGIYCNSSLGTLTVINSTFSGNSARANAAGILSGCHTTITNSTFSKNNTTAGSGGAMLTYNWSKITNSTFSENTAQSGGGIDNSGYLNITNSTFSGNSDGVYSGFSGNLQLINSILANSTSGKDCLFSNGTVTKNINNIIETNGAGSESCGIPLSTKDPKLSSLTNNGGSTQTFALLPGSPAIDAGNDSLCPSLDQSGHKRPMDGNFDGYAACDIGAYETPATWYSTASNDGWILESTETSNKGGSMDASATTFNLGDDAQNKQYRAILHFDTSTLPDNAVITKVTLKIKKQGQTGTDPFTTHQNILIDIRKGAFSADPILQLADFQAGSSQSTIGEFTNNSTNGWFATTLNKTSFPFVSLTGITQFRLRFKIDDNNDAIANMLNLVSGNNRIAANRPTLVIEYHLP